MDTETLKCPVFWGRKVSAEARTVSYDTSNQSSDQNNTIKFSKITSVGHQETYRKVNKMLRGY